LYGGGFSFLGPLAQNSMAQFANLLGRASFSLIGGAALSYQRVNHIGNFQQTLAQVRLVRVAFVQTAGLWF